MNSVDENCYFYLVVEIYYIKINVRVIGVYYCDVHIQIFAISPLVVNEKKEEKKTYKINQKNTKNISKNIFEEKKST